ncbi:cytochrome c [Pseudomonas chloritidismutans]|uniref:Photosystem II cytochrome PsbV2 n=2 Tax=Stutzerimonas stutzeri subgroup TaxID=578833 RepID=A0A2N8SZ13_STUST|nr:cytochrome c [Stutzerimonas chloritidismutans]PNG07732.1 photosystem II cytochrome PsbV2 [Stutzerimonas stutzeri]
MRSNKKCIATGVAAGIAGTLLLGAIVGITVVYTGAYNVAATEDHQPLVRWALDTTMKSSVADGASSIKPPAQFSAKTVSEGGSAYQAMCQHCHGAPGVEKSEWARGMLPQPPHLPDVVPEWKANEVFWLVKHGVRMSAMPAFGPTHNDDEIWAITAFVMQLPGMTAQKYAEFGKNDSAVAPH